jgi:hypothetical protein
MVSVMARSLCWRILLDVRAFVAIGDWSEAILIVLAVLCAADLAIIATGTT